jgi:hypothetical protein
MTLTDIEDALRRAPFIPFNIEIENGRIVHIPHPDFLLLTAGETTAWAAEGNRFVAVHLGQIHALRFLGV